MEKVSLIGSNLQTLPPGKYTVTGEGATAQSSTFTVPADQTAVILTNASTAADRTWDSHNGWHWLEGGAWLFALIITVSFAALLIRGIWNKTISISHLISEPDGKASLSRFQALLFTFVFVIALALIVVRTGRFPDEVPLGVVALLGGSLGTFLISKGLQGGLSAAAAGAPADFSPGGPTMRYGTGANKLLTTLTPEALAARTTAGSALSRLLIPAGHNGFNEPTTVATVIGGAGIKIAALPVPGVTVKGKVWYGPASAVTDVPLDFEVETTLATAPGEISEVRVAFSADRENVVVPVKVTQTA